MSFLFFWNAGWQRANKNWNSFSEQRRTRRYVFLFSCPLFSSYANQVSVLLGPSGTNFSFPFFSWKSALWVYWCPWICAGLCTQRHMSAPQCKQQGDTHTKCRCLWTLHAGRPVCCCSCSDMPSLMPSTSERFLTKPSF